MVLWVICNINTSTQFASHKVLLPILSQCSKLIKFWFLLQNSRFSELNKNLCCWKEETSWSTFICFGRGLKLCEASWWVSKMQDCSECWLMSGGGTYLCIISWSPLITFFWTAVKLVASPSYKLAARLAHNQHQDWNACWWFDFKGASLCHQCCRVLVLHMSFYIIRFLMCVWNHYHGVSLSIEL